MELAYKPDFEEARKHWDAYWEKEIIDRPCIQVVTPKDGCKEAPMPRRRTNSWEPDFHNHVDRIDAYCQSHVWLGDGIPHFRANWGPDQFAGFMGADLVLGSAPEGDPTSWAEPYVKDWKSLLPFKLDPENRWWKGALEHTAILREHAKGKYLVANMDLHSHADALTAMRGMQDFIFDMVDVPEIVEEAMRSSQALYQPVYDGIRKAGGGEEMGTIAYFYSRKRYSTVQCDLIHNIGPDMFRQFILPAIEEEIAFLDHSVWHLDGEGSLNHLDDLLALPNLNVIQWVPGAGNKHQGEWPDLYKRIQAAGKGLHLNLYPDQVKSLHKELKPEGVFYMAECDSEKEGRDLIKWLENNT